MVALPATHIVNETKTLSTVFATIMSSIHTPEPEYELRGLTLCFLRARCAGITVNVLGNADEPGEIIGLNVTDKVGDAVGLASESGVANDLVSFSAPNEIDGLGAVGEPGIVDGVADAGGTSTICEPGFGAIGKPSLAGGRGAVV